MAEFCLECWNELMETNDPPKKYHISKELDLCEGCGQWKPVLIGIKWRYRVALQFRDIIDDLKRNRRP